MCDLKMTKLYFKRLLSCDYVISNDKNGSYKNEVQSREEEMNYDISSHFQLQMYSVNLASNY